MKHFRPIRTLLSVLLALSLLASCALAVPSAARPTGAGPQAAYERVETLAAFIRVLHIDSGPNDNPMLRAWQELADSDDYVSPNRLRKMLIELFSRDPDYASLFEEVMMHCYDPFTNLFTPSGYEEAYGDDRDYTGVGFVYSAWGALLRIDSVYADSPAGRAGLQPGDWIVKVAGQDLRTLSPAARNKVMDANRGEPLALTVRRDGELLDFTVTPGHVHVPCVEYKILDGGIGILAIERFSGEDFAGDLKEAVKALRGAGVRDLILDLQGNPGGGLDELLVAVNAFVPEKGRLLFTELTRDDRFPYYSDGGGWAPDNLIILVDCDSASSAEIFTGCLSDLGLATVIGEPTYGKGRGQAGYYFDDEILMISVSAISLPVRGRYDGTGLQPDIEAPVTLTADVKALSPLPQSRVSASSAGRDIRALEERLTLLGYLWEAPDETYDEATKEAVKAASTGLGLEAAETASAELLEALQDMAEALDGAYYHTDAGLEAALELLEAEKAA